MTNIEAAAPSSNAYLPYALLLAVAVVVPVASLIAVTTASAELRAVCLLAIPIVLGGWIIATIRGLHDNGERFWKLASTYVGLVSFLVSSILLTLGSPAITSGPTESNYSTLYTIWILGSVFTCLSILWALWYNWRRTGHIGLAISLSLIQYSAAILVLLAFFLYLSVKRRNDDDWQR